MRRRTECAAGTHYLALKTVVNERTAAATFNIEVKSMSIGTILLVILVLALLGVIPVWPHARSWGYGPSGVAGVVLLILIVLLVMGRL